MTQSDKDSTRRRHLRMAAKLERRKENEARRKTSDDSRPRVRDEIDIDDWTEERGQGRRRTKSSRVPKNPASRVATVVGVARGLVHLSLDGAIVETPLGKTLFTEPLTIGDDVDVIERVNGPPRILGCRPRRSVLSRPDPGNKHKQLFVAANIDYGVIVAAAESPPLRPALLDRYLIALEQGGVQPLICINKIDQCTPGAERDNLERVLAPYRDLESDCNVLTVCVSASTGEGMDSLRDALAGNTVVLVGHSGVGKSSLLNALARETLAGAGDVRAFDGRGRHTTTASTLYELDDGIRVIDTAGVRSFGLWGLSADELRSSFPGLARLAVKCRFANCMHLVEADCAVRAAVDTGSFSRERYGIFVRMVEESQADE